VESITLLLVDDDVDLLHLLQQRLVYDGFQIITAESGRQALLALDHCLPDLVILSLLLSDVNSFQLVEQMKSQRGIPVIFLTPVNGIRTRAAEVRCCAADYAVEPFEYEELLDRIHRVLSQTRRLVSEEPTKLIRASQGEISLKSPTALPNYLLKLH